MSKNSSNVTHRCERCNRPLSDSSARYGWRCAEILGVTPELNQADDETFEIYMLSIEQANCFLQENDIDISGMDMASFYESFIKMYLAQSLNDKTNFDIAYQEMLQELAPTGRVLQVPQAKKNISDFFLYRQLSALAKGAVPSLSYIDPLQSEYTGVGVRTPVNKLSGQQQLYDIDSHWRLFEVDAENISGQKGVFEMGDPHFNLRAAKDAPASHKIFAQQYNHYPATEAQYNVFHNFDEIIGASKKVGKAMGCIGLALDAFEMGEAIYVDLNDMDQSLGKTTLKTAVGIGSSWGGAAVGAKVGAMGGAAVGTVLIPVPGVGTAIGGFIGGTVGGIAGSIGARKLGELIVDETYQKEW